MQTSNAGTLRLDHTKEKLSKISTFNFCYFPFLSKKKNATTVLPSWGLLESTDLNVTIRCALKWFILTYSLTQNLVLVIQAYIFKENESYHSPTLSLTAS